MTIEANGRAAPVIPGFEHVDTWIFDLDNTLYPAACDLFSQVDQRMSTFIADWLGMARDEARSLQKDYFRRHGTTLKGLMSEHGLEPSTFLEFVHDIDVSPVAPDPILDRNLAALPGRRLIFTNASCDHVQRVTDRLGIADRFEGVWDIVAADFVPKPQPSSYDAMIAHFDIDPSKSVFVEDMAVNLAPAHALGMTTVWVNTQESWAAAGSDSRYVDHRIESVADWLASLMFDTETPPN